MVIRFRQVCAVHFVAVIGKKKAPASRVGECDLFFLFFFEMCVLLLVELWKVFLDFFL